MFVFGGMMDCAVVLLQTCNKCFDTETDCWLNSPSAQLQPESRMRHSAFDYNEELYIFGGINYIHTTTDYLWKFNPEQFSWKEVEPMGKGMRPVKMLMCCCMVGDRIILIRQVSTDDVYVLDLSPSLKTLFKLAVIQNGLVESELPHNIRWELGVMTKDKKGSDAHWSTHLSSKKCSL